MDRILLLVCEEVCWRLHSIFSLEMEMEIRNDACRGGWGS